MTMSKLLFTIVSFAFILAGCNSEVDSAGESRPTNLPVNHSSAMVAHPMQAGGLKFFKMDGTTPLTDPSTENQIMVCSLKMEFCVSTCVSIYFPNVERYSVFKTGWLQSNKCMTYGLQYPDGTNIPKMLYYEGTYAGSACTIDTAAPDFDGKGYVSEVRVPDGQASPAPNGARIYNVHNFFDSNDNFISSVFIYNYRPPSSWDYMDNTVAPGYITPTLVNGYSCVRRNQIQ